MDHCGVRVRVELRASELPVDRLGGFKVRRFGLHENPIARS